MESWYTCVNPSHNYITLLSPSIQQTVKTKVSVFYVNIPLL